MTILTRPAVPLPRLLAPALPRRRVKPWLVSWLQVSPLAFILIALFALPTFLFAVVSFFDYDRTGIYPAFILDNYRDLLTTPATIRVYVSSLTFAVIVWAITLFLGFNIAHFLIFHVRSAAVRTVFFLLCAIPFWTSGIIRTIAWIPFLGRNGAFNQIVMGAGLTSQPLDFLLFHWREGGIGALVSGIGHGAYCLGCCWMLMALLFVGGIMNLAWIAAIALLVLIEKTLPRGGWMGRATGAVLVIWGGVTLAVAA